MRRLALVIAAAFVVGGCGTSTGVLEVSSSTTAPATSAAPETTPSSTVADVTTTTEAAAVVPAPRPDAPGVVMLDGAAVPVTTFDGTTWRAVDRCGIEHVGTTPAPLRAVVVLDPVGDGAALAVNVHIAERTAGLLADQGVSTVLTRTGNAAVDPTERAAAADAAGARVLVAIATVVGGETGPEFVPRVADDESRRLASLLHEAVTPTLDPAAAWAGESAGVRAVLNQRGEDWFVVVRAAQGPATAVVHLPVADVGGVEVVAADVDGLAAAVADAVWRQLTTDESGTGFATPPEVVRQAVSGSPVPAC